MKTIKQIADELGVSKTAVRKKLTDEVRTKFAETIGNTVYISEQGETLIKKGFAKPIGNMVSENPTETVSDLVSTLKAELSIKNQQISDLSAALVSAQEQAATVQQSLLAAQALHGETVRLLIGAGSTGGEAPADDIEAEISDSAEPLAEPIQENEIIADLQKKLADSESEREQLSDILAEKQRKEKRGIFGLFSRKS